MSGIFKSIKKVFKKVGKVVKKIAPYLIIAGAVYFGGSYLMSLYGGASASAAGSAATSFTKSAGVWKSFFSGITNGTASQSAAAFAEASYQTSIGAGALSLSGQVAAGTSAVNSLNGVLSTQQAVAAGVDFARGAWTQAGGDAQSGWNIIFKGLNQSQAINTGQLSIDAAGSSAVTTLDSSTMAKIDSDAAAGMFRPNQYSTAELDFDGMPKTASSVVQGAPSADLSPVGDVSHPSGVDYSQHGGTIAAAQGQGATSTQLTSDGGINYQQLILDSMNNQNAVARQQNQSYMDYLNRAMDQRRDANKNQLLWSIAQTGLKTVGSYLTAKDEADYRDKHDPLNWEKKEDEPRWQRGIITG